MNSKTNINVESIPASDLIVEQYVKNLIENLPYTAAPNLGVNSNSAAQAIANRSAMRHIPNPGGRTALGSQNWWKIKFKKDN